MPDEVAMLRKYLQHKLNPLHVYCRLRTVRVNKGLAYRFCQAYERYFYRAFMS
jgi:hypothetical protein